MKTVSNHRHAADPVDMLRTDINAIKKDIAAMVNGRMHDVGEFARDAMHKAGENARELADQGKETAAIMHKKLGEAAGARPVTTILLSALAGAIGVKILGHMMSRKDG